MSVSFTSQLRVGQGLMPSIWLLAREREKTGDGSQSHNERGDKWE